MLEQVITSYLFHEMLTKSSKSVNYLFDAIPTATVRFLGSSICNILYSKKKIRKNKFNIPIVTQMTIAFFGCIFLL